MIQKTYTRFVPLMEEICKQPIQYLFEEQVKRTPDDTALIFGQQKLAYCDLNRQANQLAWYLQAQGVRPGISVGICMERSLEAIVAILGVLKAGGAYVPFDPTYPQERQAFMLQDSQIRLLLTQEALANHLPAQGVSIICVDTEWPAIAQNCSENCKSSVSNRDLAYIIYTSGSTGLPKGVLVEQYGLGNMIAEQIRLFEIDAHHRIAQFASFSFDASVSEIFMALLAGAELCIIPSERRWPAATLQQFLREQAITTITLPPSLLAHLSPAELPALRTVISAGEELAASTAACWSPGRLFFNAYGPTEGTVCTTINTCGQQVKRPSIGEPIANTQVYLLDSQLQPVPTGVPTELYIGGAGLARGYLNHPELTAAKFIPHPFSNTAGERLYKTGDLARYLPDGSLEYLGRIDRMVKVRGFRIELEEVEAVLDQHPLLRQSLVTVCQDNCGTKRLIAYLIPHSAYLEKPPSEAARAALQDELARFLRVKLPRYMLPVAFVLLDTFPLTPNGKIDRNALPIPQTFHRVERESNEAPL